MACERAQDGDDGASKGRWLGRVKEYPRKRRRRRERHNLADLCVGHEDDTRAPSCASGQHAFALRAAVCRFLGATPSAPPRAACSRLEKETVHRRQSLGLALLFQHRPPPLRLLSATKHLRVAQHAALAALRHREGQKILRAFLQVQGTLTRRHALDGRPGFERIVWAVSHCGIKTEVLLRVKDRTIFLLLVLLLLLLLLPLNAIVGLPVL